MFETLLNVTTDSASVDTEPRSDQLASLAMGIAQGAVDRLEPAQGWALLEAALQGAFPSRAFGAWRAVRGLSRWLPEVDALFGVPQLSDSPDGVDVGEHQLRQADAASAAQLPLYARFAALMHKIGKGGTPRDIWPAHYQSEWRGQQMLSALQQRLGVPAEALSFARLVVDEVDRIHRASDLRAGPIAEMLTRLDAAAQPRRFEALLAVCTADWVAYGHAAQDYRKAERMRKALRAYLDVRPVGGTELGGLDESSADALAHRQAQAVAQALMPGWVESNG